MYFHYAYFVNKESIAELYATTGATDNPFRASAQFSQFRPNDCGLVEPAVVFLCRTEVRYNLNSINQEAYPSEACVLGHLPPPADCTPPTREALTSR